MSDKQTGPAAAAPQPRSDGRWTMLGALGGEVSEIGQDFARGFLPLTEAVMQPTRVFHAGAIVVLADEVASAAIYGPVEPELLPDKPFPYSIQISLNLMTNDPVGPLTAESRVVRRGRVTVVDTQVLGSHGKTVALMRSTHLMVDLKKTGPHKADILK